MIPAAWHFKTANGTASLGGSANAKQPTKTCSLKGKFGFYKLKSKPGGYLSLVNLK